MARDIIQTPRAAAILVLNYNGKMHLDTCLKSVLAQTGPQDQLYLVDNGSTDGSVEYVKEHYPAVKLIRFERNLGFAEAYNRAVRSISEELVILLNNDTEVEKGWLMALKSAYVGSAGRVAVCGSKILFYHDRGLVNHLGGKLVPIGGGFDIAFMKRDRQDEDGEHYVGCVSGASMMVSRAVFLKLGGFDPDFFAYFEDADFCWRAWLAGFGILFVPSSIMYHKLGATARSLLGTERVFLGERNRVQSMVKNLELSNLVLAGFASVAHILIRVVVFLASRKPLSALAIIRGNLWALRHLPNLVRKRRHVQQIRRFRDSYLVTHDLMASYTEGFREFIRLVHLEEELYMLREGALPPRR